MVCYNPNSQYEHYMATFPDEIGRYCYNVDIHPTSRNREAFEAFKKVFEGKRYKPGESYGVPFRVLLPKGVDNVLCAGRMLGAPDTIDTFRLICPCFVTGEAAGTAAGLAALKGCTPRERDVSALQNRLEKANVCLA